MLDALTTLMTWLAVVGGIMFFLMVIVVLVLSAGVVIAAYLEYRGERQRKRE